MLKCEIGGCYSRPVEKAHIKSKGSGGSNKPHNIICLCIEHHRTGPFALDHNKGPWWFADHFGLRERFEQVFEKERELQRSRLHDRLTRQRQRSRKRYCPTCRRRWSKGVPR